MCSVLDSDDSFNSGYCEVSFYAWCEPVGFDEGVAVSFVSDVDVGIVLEFVGDAAAGGVYGLWAVWEHLGNDVNVMYCEVFYDAHVTDSVWSAAYPAGVGEDYVADGSLFDVFEGFLYCGVEAFNETYCEFDVVFLCEVD